MAQQKGNILLFVLLGIVLLFVALFVAGRLILQPLLQKGVSQAINASATQIKNLDYSKGQVLPVSQSFSKDAGLVVGLNMGHLIIDGKQAGKLIKGEIKYLGEKPSVVFQKDSSILTIQSADQKGEETTLHISPTLTTTVQIGVGAGIVDADLNELDITAINIAAGAGEINVTLPRNNSVKASLAAGAGNLKIYVPKGVGQNVIFGQGLPTDLQLGSEYVKTEKGFQTKGYDSAKVQAEITIGQALGGFDIQPIE